MSNPKSNNPFNIFTVKDNTLSQGIDEILPGEGIKVTESGKIRIVSVKPPEGTNIGGVKRKPSTSNIIQIEADGSIYADGGGSTYEIGKGLKLVTDQQTQKESLTTDVDSTQFEYNDSTLKIKESVLPDATKIAKLESDINKINMMLGVKDVLLQGGSFSSSSEAYTTIKNSLVNGTLIIQFSHQDKIVIKINVFFTTSMFDDTLLSVEDIASYIQAEVIKSHSEFSCIWHETENRFELKTLLSNINVNYCDTSELIAGLLKLTIPTNATLIESTSKYYDYSLNKETSIINSRLGEVDARLEGDEIEIYTVKNVLGIKSNFIFSGVWNESEDAIYNTIKNNMPLSTTDLEFTFDDQKTGNTILITVSFDRAMFDTDILSLQDLMDYITSTGVNTIETFIFSWMPIEQKFYCSSGKNELMLHICNDSDTIASILKINEVSSGSLVNVDSVDFANSIYSRTKESNKIDPKLLEKIESSIIDTKIIKDVLRYNNKILYSGEWPNQHTSQQIYGLIKDLFVSQVTNKNLQIKITLENGDDYGILISFAPDIFDTQLTDIYKIATFITNECNQDAKLRYFNCFWNDATLKFVCVLTDTVEKSTIALSSNTNEMANILRFTALDGAVLDNFTNLDIINGVYNRATNATQTVIPGQNIDVEYTDRDVTISSMTSDSKKYAQYKWDITNSGYTINTIANALIPLASITDVTIQEVQYTRKLYFSLTGLVPTQLINNIQFYCFVGQINLDKTLTTKSYYGGIQIADWASVKAIILQNLSISIFWKEVSTNIVEKLTITLLPADAETTVTLTNKINSEVRGHSLNLSTFKCQYSSGYKKFYMSCENNNIEFVNDAIKDNHSYPVNVACGLFVDSQKGSATLFNHLARGMAQIPNISDNQIWVSQQFQLADNTTLSNLKITNDYVSFRANLSQFAQSIESVSIFGMFKADNIPLITFTSKDAELLESTNFFPNRLSFNHKGTTSSPVRWINSQYLLDYNSWGISPVVIARYNYWDYNVTLEKTVIINIPLVKYQQILRSWEQKITYQYNSSIKPDSHYIQLIIDATGTDYTINGLSRYVSPLINVLYSEKQTNTDGIATEVSNKTFTIACNENKISVAEPSADIPSSTLDIPEWDSSVQYSAREMVTLTQANNKGIFMATEQNKNQNPWSTNMWVAFGNMNTLHVTSISTDNNMLDTVKTVGNVKTVNLTTGINAVLVHMSSDILEININLPAQTDIKETYTCIIKCCSIHPEAKLKLIASNGDKFEDNVSEKVLISSTDNIKIIMYHDEDKIYLG